MNSGIMVARQTIIVVLSWLLGSLNFLTAYTLFQGKYRVVSRNSEFIQHYITAAFAAQGPDPGPTAC